MNKDNQHDSFEILKALYNINADDAIFYKEASFFAKRILFKNFFNRLNMQKESACTALKIVGLSAMDQDFTISYKNKLCTLNDQNHFYLNYFNYERNKNRIISECHDREQNAGIIYKLAIAHIEDQRIIEILQIHHDNIQNHLVEMRIMGVKTFLI